jgi:hypothetical protein
MSDANLAKMYPDLVKSGGLLAPSVLHSSGNSRLRSMGSGRSGMLMRASSRPNA